MPPKTKTEKIKEVTHWTYNGSEITKTEQTPDKSFAFIYKITFDDGRFYFGKKYLWKPNYTSGVKKGQSKGAYPFVNYISSSKEVKQLIKDGLKYKKEILFFTFSRAETTYKETQQILCGNFLTNPQCLNFWVKATIFSRHLKENT